MSLPPLLPRLVLYHQTHHSPTTGDPVSLLPLLTKVPVRLHPHIVLIVGAVHLNDPPRLHLNDDPPTHPKFNALKQELPLIRTSGITTLCMLGGAAGGTFSRLDSPLWESYYAQLHDFLRTWELQGIDLDVEEPMSLAGIVRLIDRLRADFGPGFIITLAPVASALRGGRHLSGFEYAELEAARGMHIAWYNAQFYCGWGRVDDCGGLGERVVVGVVTNPTNAEGWDAGAPGKVSGRAVGGVAGWEWFNALPGGIDRPWEWVLEMAGALGLVEEVQVNMVREMRLRRFGGRQ